MDEEICMRRFSCLDKKETSLGFQRSSPPTPIGEKIEGEERERESVCVCVWRRENPCNRGKRLWCGLFCFWSRAIRFSKVGVQGNWKKCAGFARFVKIFFWVLFGHLEEVIILTKKGRAPTAAAGTFLFGLPCGPSSVSGVFWFRMQRNPFFPGTCACFFERAIMIML
jgi:hypothetical protein